MRSAADFRAWAERQWRRRWPEWLAGHSEPTSWPLHPPTESVVAGDPTGVAAWVREWSALERSGQVRLEWVTKMWRGVGRQVLPARAMASAAEMAQLAGQFELWERASSAVAQVVRAFPAAAPSVESLARRLGALDEAGVVSLLSAVAWLEANPGSGLWERELPVAGVDSKWLERHREVVAGLVEAVAPGGDSGLRRRGGLFQVRALDPSLVAGPESFAVDLDGLRELDWAPSRVLISENVTVLDTLPALAGTVAVHGRGFAAPTLADVPWLTRAEQWYWGDLDTYGLLILGRVRAALPQVGSVLMDPDTFAAHRNFAVVEPRPFTGDVGYLTATELESLRLVWEGSWRLEQERIPREWVAATLTR